ncbi:MAG TPA: carboxypeptidase-like regulatory domain-containing protein, partial [Candidatus Polarisedimenticolia bacterium]|nr:carboxypeptidase-like regulatory domain-containing protein [Candidatus Polarisedimenticolia bacterium]
MRTLTGWRRLTAIGTLAGPISLLLSATGSMASEPQILGRITDPDGAAVADAMVFLTPVNHANGADLLPTRTLRSDRNGAFYAALPAGRYRVAAVKQGYDVAMTDLHSRARGVLRLEMARSSGLAPGAGAPGETGGNLGTGWILRQQRDNVLRAVQPDPAGGAARGEAVRADTSAADNAGWAAALFTPLDG